MKKRLISYILAVALLFNCIVISGFAYHKEEGIEYSSSELKEIEAERQKLTDFLAKQLEAQGSLDKLDDFMFLVDDTIQNKYYPNSANTPDYVYAANGGWLKGTGPYIEVEAQFFTPDQCQQMYDKKPSTEESLKEFLERLGIYAITGVGKIGMILKLGRLLATIQNDMLWSNVDVGTDGLVVYAVYDTMELKTTTVFWGWDEYPLMPLNQYHLDNVTYGVFS